MVDKERMFSQDYCSADVVPGARQLIRCYVLRGELTEEGKCWCLDISTLDIYSAVSTQYLHSSR